ncbi:MAG: DNA recombination protein RmuC [Alphaproteobacteria bacterium]
MDMTTALVIVAVALVIGGMIAAAIVYGRLHGQREDRGAARIDEMIGRLSQLTEAQATAQTQLGERLQAQERALSKALDERLAQVTTRVGETLEKTQTQQRVALDDLKTRLMTIDSAQKNITELSAQVVGLQDILGNKQARGAFGEVQLRDLVDMVLPPSARRYQAPIGDNKRVDCLLLLPNPPGPIAIDAKFPLESYTAMMNAEDDQTRKAARRQLKTDVLRHVDDIAAKYIVPGETAEAALMFLPSEAIYVELHSNFADVIQASYRARVFIVSPTTLWATLNTIRAVLKDVRMREAAGLIQHEVEKLMVDVKRLDDRSEKLQRHFAQASEDVRQIRISTDKIVSKGAGIQELQLADEPEKEAVTEPPQPDLLQSEPQLRRA